MLICIKCGDYVEGKSFCSNCGERVEEKVFCTNCGNCVTGENFCTTCGVAVGVSQLHKGYGNTAGVSTVTPIKKSLSARSKIIIGAIGFVVLAVIIAIAILLTGVTAERPLTVAELLEVAERYLLEGNYEQALVEFIRVIETDPMEPRGYTGAAETYVGLGNFDDAIDVLHQGLNILPDNPEIIEMLEVVEDILGSDYVITRTEPEYPVETIDRQFEEVTAVEVIIEPTFEFLRVFDFSEGLAAVVTGDWPQYIGFVDANGNMAIPFTEFDLLSHISPMSEDVVIPIRFSDGLAAIARENGFNVIDKSGAQVMSSPYHLRGFSEGRIVVMDSYWQVGVIDITGNVVVPFGRYEWIRSFSEGFAAVRSGDMFTDTWGFIDRYGNEVIATMYSYVGDFSEGLAAAWIGEVIWDEWEHDAEEITGGMGFIDTSGNVSIPFVFDMPGGLYSAFRFFPPRFSDGLAGVRIDGMRVIIDKAGNTMPIEEDIYVRSTAEGLIAVTRDWETWGFVDSAGNEVVPLTYAWVRDFSEGLAAVGVGTWDNRQVGFIDRAGNEVVPPIYDEVRSFSEGLAWVRQGSRWGLLYAYVKEIDISIDDITINHSDSVGFGDGWALEKANYISSELDALGWKNIISQIGDPLLQAGGGGFYAKITADEGGVANVTIYIEGHDIFWIIYESNIGEGAHGARRHKQSTFSELHLISPTEVIVMHEQVN